KEWDHGVLACGSGRRNGSRAREDRTFRSAAQNERARSVVDRVSGRRERDRQLRSPSHLPTTLRNSNERGETGGGDDSLAGGAGGDAAVQVDREALEQSRNQSHGGSAVSDADDQDADDRILPDGSWAAGTVLARVGLRRDAGDARSEHLVGVLGRAPKRSGS